MIKGGTTCFFASCLRRARKASHNYWSAGLVWPDKGKAIVAIMRKLVLTLWYVAQDEVFDTRKLFNTRTLGLAT